MNRPDWRQRLRILESLPSSYSSKVSFTFEVLPGMRGQASLFTGNVAASVQRPSDPLDTRGEAAYFAIGFCLLAGNLITSLGPMTPEMAQWFGAGSTLLDDWSEQTASSTDVGYVALDALSRMVGPGVPFPFAMRDERIPSDASVASTVTIGGTVEVRQKPEFWSLIHPQRDGFGFLDRRRRLAALMTMTCHHLYIRQWVLREPEQRMYFDRVAAILALVQRDSATRDLGFQRWFAAAATAYKEVWP